MRLRWHDGELVLFGGFWLLRFGPGGIEVRVDEL